MTLVVAGRIVGNIAVTATLPAPAADASQLEGAPQLHSFAVEPAIDAIPGPRCAIRLTQPPVPRAALYAFVLDVVGTLFPDTEADAQQALQAELGLAPGDDWRAVVRERMGYVGPDLEQAETWLKRQWASVGRDPLRSPTVEAWAASVVDLNWIDPPSPPVRAWRELVQEVHIRTATGKLGQEAFDVLFRNYEALTTADRLLVDQELVRQASQGLTDGDRFGAQAVIGKFLIIEAIEPLSELVASLRVEGADDSTARFEATRAAKIIDRLAAHGDAPRPLDVPPELIGRADRTKGGFLYDVAGPFPSMDGVTLDHVRRAFKLDADGWPTGEVEVNVNFDEQPGRAGL